MSSNFWDSGAKSAPGPSGDDEVEQFFKKLLRGAAKFGKIADSLSQVQTVAAQPSAQLMLLANFTARIALRLGIAEDGFLGICRSCYQSAAAKAGANKAGA